MKRTRVAAVHNSTEVEHRSLPPYACNEAAARLLLCAWRRNTSTGHHVHLVIRLSLATRSRPGKNGIDVMLQSTLDCARSLEELARIQRAFVLFSPLPMRKSRSLAEREKNDVSAAHES